MSATAAREPEQHLRWVEQPCSHVGAVDLTLYVDGNYFGVACTSTARVGEWDGWMRAVVGGGREIGHFKTREECVAFLEIAAHGGERGRA